MSNSLSGEITKNIKRMSSQSLTSLLLENKLNSLFLNAKKQENRIGLHASAIIQSNVCLREQVLSLIYERDTEDRKLPINVIRIFKEGDYVHKKWQDLFETNNMAVGIEQRGYSKKYRLLMTPDAIIEIGDKKYICEIKSANEFAYKNIVNVHSTGNKQLQLYMHFYCIPNGVVLVENKNTQEFKILYVEYDVNEVKPILERLKQINDGYEMFSSDNILPHRLCEKQTDKRAENCAFCGACFGTDKRKIY